MSTAREGILLEGASLTSGDRNDAYGDPAANLTVQMSLWAMYSAASQGKHSPAHEAAMQHVFAKIARIACGKAGHRDNYVDAATYIAIAWECDQ